MLDDNKLMQEADRCVKCGLCLPHCPTYRLTYDEAESPRGRIALIQALVKGDLNPEPHLRQHLSRCLHCLNCERSCPSGVSYHQIIDTGIAKVSPSRRPLLDMLVKLSLSPLALALLRLFRNSPLYSLSHKISWGRLRNLSGLLPAMDASPLPTSLSYQDSRTGLFLGCISRITERNTIASFIDVAEKLGIALAIPSQQVCCGAMHRHSGDIQKADQLEQINRTAFKDIDTVISLATGCGSHLRIPTNLNAIDASQFLCEREWPQHITLIKYPHKVAVHTPCSQKSDKKSVNAVTTLLNKIPGLETVQLSSGYGCCGGAGHQLIEQEGMSRQLLNPILDEIAQLQVSAVLTSNTGCALHIKRGLTQRNLDIEVLHPVELIARQIAE